MSYGKANLEDRNWNRIAGNLLEEGYSLMPGFLDHQLCEAIKALYSENDLYRKTVLMERHRFGKGEYKYFRYPLPSIIDDIRKEVYFKLAPIANDWNFKLGNTQDYPSSSEDFKDVCASYGQLLATP